MKRAVDKTINTEAATCEDWGSFN